MPPVTRACTWPRALELAQLPPAGAGQAAVRRLAVPEVANPWQRLARAAGGGGSGGGGAVPLPDAWSGEGLEVPEERNMHFFVRSMAELHGCHGNE